MGVLGAGCSPLSLRGQETIFEGLRKKKFLIGDDNGKLLDHLKSLKQQNFLIGDRKGRLLEMLLAIF
jgi:hypothetical protein